MPRFGWEAVVEGCKGHEGGHKWVNRFSEAYWFWVISDGVPKTKMKGWEKFLTEEQRWQVMAYEHMFSHRRFEFPAHARGYLQDAMLSLRR